MILKHQNVFPDHKILISLLPVQWRSVLLLTDVHFAYTFKYMLPSLIRISLIRIPKKVAYRYSWLIKLRPAETCDDPCIHVPLCFVQALSETTAFSSAFLLAFLECFLQANKLEC